MHSLSSQSNLTSLSLLLAERGTALGTRGRAGDGALFAPRSFKQPVQKCRDCCCGWEKWGGPELSRGSLIWTGSPTTALCTASSGKLCFMMGMQLLLHLCGYWAASSRDLEQSFLLHIRESLTESLHENPWTRWKRQDERFLPFLSPSSTA